MKRKKWKWMAAFLAAVFLMLGTTKQLYAQELPEAASTELQMEESGTTEEENTEEGAVGGTAYAMQVPPMAPLMAPSPRIDESIHSMNLWRADGSPASGTEMTVWKNDDTSTDSPQVIYAWLGDPADSLSLFCIDYGKAMRTGDSYATDSDYDKLNREQKKAIGYVLGTAQRVQAPRNNGSFNDYGGENTWVNWRLYNSTQLMIWYYIDKYYQPGMNEGIGWAGVVKTCNSGWGDLAECERIKDVVDNLFEIPSFTSEMIQSAPNYKLTYNPSTGLYETILSDTRGVLGRFNFSGAGLSFNRCNADGSLNADGSYLKVSSAELIPQGAAVSVSAVHPAQTGNITYIKNQSNPQDLIVCTSARPDPVQAYMNFYTESILTVSKQDITTSQELPGATLSITSTDGGTTYDTWTSGAAPHVVRGLPTGTYLLTEVLPPAGYVTASSITFTYDADSGIAQTIVMKDQLTRVELLKTDENGKPLAGALLEVYNAVGGKVASFTSGKEAYVLTGLPVGTYTLREAKAPAGYVTAKDVRFTIPDTPQTVRVVMEDKQTRVELLKTDENGKPLAGALLEVYNSVGGKVASFTSGKEAYVLNGLPVGTYTLREAKTPAGYVTARDVKFTIPDTPQTVRVTMEDKPVEGRIRIVKTGDQVIAAKEYTSVYGSFKRLSFAQKPLSGVVFGIYDEDGTLVASVTTGADGKVETKTLPWGTYFIQELKTPAGLVMAGERIRVELSCPEEWHENIYVKEVSLKNSVGDTEINVYKIGEILNIEDGTYSFGTKPLEGVIFGVYADADIKNWKGETVIEKDECIGYIRTGADGKAALKDALVEGTYYYREVQTLEGYILDPTKHVFTLNLGNEELNTMDVNKENPEVNQLYKTNLRIVKSDSADARIRLCGVKFALYNENDELMGIFVTDENGEIIIDDLPYGSYYFVEKKAAEGYQIDTERQIFTADAPGAMLEITNEKIPETPKTGDQRKPGMAILIGLAAILGLLIIIHEYQRKQKNR